MNDLRKLLDNYSITYPDENQTNEVINFLEKEDCFLNTNYKGHFTASAWIVNKQRDKVLMTHHKKLNMWLQLGGHADGENDLLKVALREAEEESGLKKFKLLSNEIFDLDIHTIPKYHKEPSHIHYDIRFIFEADSYDGNISISEESKDVSWIDLIMVLEKNSEPSIERMLRKTKEKFL